MSDLARKCVLLRRYLRLVLQPAGLELQAKLDTDSLALYDVVANVGFIAHAIDYMKAVVDATGEPVSRIDMVKKFDKIHEVSGARYLNHKFLLANLVNNACKHVEVDEKRHPGTRERYGGLAFRNLKSVSGRIYFCAKKHRFDFGRVVLRPIYEVFDCVGLASVDDAVKFVNGEYVAIVDTYDPHLDEDDPSTAIDRMIEYCHPLCLDCGEDSGECKCEQYIYPEGPGECNPDYDEEFDFDKVMSEISGAYKP